MCLPFVFIQKIDINYVLHIQSVSHNTTIFSMCNELLHWVQLHVSVLGIGTHLVVLRLIEQLYNRQSILGRGGTRSLPHTTTPTIHSIPCLLYSYSISLRTT